MKVLVQQEGQFAVFGWAGHWPAGGKQLYQASFVFLVLSFCFITVIISFTSFQFYMVILTHELYLLDQGVGK